MKVILTFVVATLAAAEGDASGLLQIQKARKTQPTCDLTDEKPKFCANWANAAKCGMRRFKKKCQQTCCKLLQPPLICGANEHVSNCGNRCERQCGDPNPKMCPKVCDPPACQCDEGFVRKDGQCVREEQACGLTCGLNEHVNSCGNQCERQCGDPNPKMCPMICNPPACECDKGFVRKDGQCVLEEQACGLTCGLNEHVNSCGNRCERKCGDPNPKMCPMICDPPACECDKGFVRKDGQCVLEEQSCGLTCGENEVENACGNRCEPSCGDTGPKMCPMICDPPACQCKEGHARNAAGNCVPVLGAKGSFPLKCN